MAEGIPKLVEADMAVISPDHPANASPKERVARMMAHILLRLWTRLALETGQRLTMQPSQYVLGTYEGKMNWILDETLDFAGMSQIELGATYGQRHALVGEIYSHKGVERARLMFTLEEEEVRGKPLSVNYLLFDEPIGSFRLDAATRAVMPALNSWFETVLTRMDAPLWSFCKDKLECVGA